MERADTIIVGAGPAGLACAYELSKAGKKVIVLEKDQQVGGISKTIKFKGCFFDLGGHRFHTGYPEVMDLWEEVLGEDFLIRPRLSRIFFKNKFFNYPLTPINAFFGLGPLESIGLTLSYCKSKVFPFKQENNIEEWISNRFGHKMFVTFFKTYTEKLWGIPCQDIKAEWAAQRISGLSLAGAISNAFLGTFFSKPKTLIDKFRYPKYGPGMMYEKMAEKIVEFGGRVVLGSTIEKIVLGSDDSITSIWSRENGVDNQYFADSYVSSIPLDELITNIEGTVPAPVLEASVKLRYRGFVSVSLIMDCPNPFPDNWIYVHSPEIKMGRIQNYQNWSPYMSGGANKTILGLEYFCDENDSFWNLPDQDIINFGLHELEKIKLGRKIDYVDGFVSRVRKAYPIYDDAYPASAEYIKGYLRRIKNLQTIGRSGLFRYNNMDHSVLAGQYAARNIMGEQLDIWAING